MRTRINEPSPASGNGNGTIVLAGGSGFLGTLLQRHFRDAGHRVVVLTRGEPGSRGGVEFLHWDGRTVGPWISELGGADAVVNLAGKNVDCRYTPEALAEIDRSRTESVEAVAAAINACAVKPRVWIQASTTAIYGDAGDRRCDEAALPGAGVPVATATKWERAFHDHPTPGVRRVLLRISFVLSAEGGALPVLDRLVRMFLGGRIGSGRQRVSWIHAADFCACVARAVGDGSLQGVFNVAAPEAPTNAEFMRALRRVRHRPWSPPVPTPIVHLGSRLMGTEPVLALTGRRAVPDRLEAAGFRFAHPALEEALGDLLATPRRGPRRRGATLNPSPPPLTLGANELARTPHRRPDPQP